MERAFAQLVHQNQGRTRHTRSRAGTPAGRSSSWRGVPLAWEREPKKQEGGAPMPHPSGRRSAPKAGPQCVLRTGAFWKDHSSADTAHRSWSSHCGL